MRAFLGILICGFLLQVVCSINCVTLTSGCMKSIKQIHRLGLFRDKDNHPTDFVYTITQYNTSDCLYDQFYLKYEEKLSCRQDLLVPYDLSCQATVNNIYLNISDVDAMKRLGYACSESDVRKEIAILDTSCSTQTRTGFHQIIQQLDSTRTYYINQLENDKYQIGNVIFSHDDHSLCDTSYLIDVAMIGWVTGVIVVVGSFVLYKCKKRRNTKRRRLSTNNRKDLGVENEIELTAFDSPMTE